MRTHEQPKSDEYPSIMQLTWPGKLLAADITNYDERVVIGLSLERIATIYKYRSGRYSLWIRTCPVSAKYMKRDDWLILINDVLNPIHEKYILESQLELLAMAHHVYQQEQERIACQRSKTTTPTPSTTP